MVFVAYCGFALRVAWYLGLLAGGLLHLLCDTWMLVLLVCGCLFGLFVDITLFSARG